MNPISIVGAGPGALDLMTIRAQQRLKTADVLVWTDSLIPIQITKLVKDDCEKIKTSSLTLEEIILILIKKHKEGKKIVRLHDGDPCLYGAISEQICRLNDEGIEVESSSWSKCLSSNSSNFRLRTNNSRFNPNNNT